MVSPALWSAGSTQYCEVTMRRSLSSLWPTIMDPVFETAFPTTIVEQESAGAEAMRPAIAAVTAVAM